MTTNAALSSLVTSIDAVNRLQETLTAYELTGDHDHSTNGTRPLAVGAPCPGGDCLVAKARRIIAAMQDER